MPDRMPVDFLATGKVWDGLIASGQIPPVELTADMYFDPAREQILRRFAVDCRVLSYDMFFMPPDSYLSSEGSTDWWVAADRSTPNRMWRKFDGGTKLVDLWGRQTEITANQFGSYEEIRRNPLAEAESLADLQSYAWPNPAWWDFSPISGLIETINQDEEKSIRYRIGSIFETAWQLRGMEQFMVDMVTDRAMAAYIMDRITDIHVTNLEKALTEARGMIDVVYFYDDVASQNSLLFSKKTWRDLIRPRHQRVTETARAFNVKVMYHSDGAIAPLIPELIDLGIDILNPIQTNVPGMEPAFLKKEFGDKLCFHGGIDIVSTLRIGTPADVRNEVLSRIADLGGNGGYILSSSHHIQGDTPLANVSAMYEMDLR